MPNPVFTSCIAAAFLLAACCSAAATVDTDAATFASQRQAIEAELATGSRYAEIGRAERREVLESLDLIGSMLSRYGGVDETPPNERVRLFNAQERVNQILTRAAADSRLHCQRERPTGSHRHTTVCVTVAERERIREHSRRTSDYMRNPGHMPLAPKGGEP
jgi:hypothetical protein